MQSNAGQSTGAAGGRLITVPVQVTAWPRQRCDSRNETYSSDDVEGEGFAVEGFAEAACVAAAEGGSGRFGLKARFQPKRTRNDRATKRT